MKVITFINKKSLRLAVRLDRVMRKLPLWLWVSMAIVTAFLAFFIIYIGTVHADSQGPNGPGTTADDATVGTVAWTSTGSVTASDNVYATMSLGDAVVGHYIKVTNFGFSIPSGSTINGIVAEAEEKATTSTKGKITDNSVKIVKGGTIGGTDQATTATWPSADTFISYGGSTNLWGQTWTVSDINASTFGVVISAKNVHVSNPGATLTVSLDYIRMTVYYTPPQAVLSQASYRFFNNSDASSAVTFAKAWGGTGAEDYGSVVRTSDGGYAVAGQTDSFGSGSTDLYIGKLTATAGAVSWNTAWGYSSIETEAKTIATADGGYLSAATTNGGGGINEIVIIKYDSSGNVSWTKTWHGATGEQAFWVAQTTDNGFVVTGDTQSFGTGIDVITIKYDSSGNVLWNKNWGGTNDDEGRGVAATSDGGCIVVGRTQNFGAGNYDAVLLKYDSSGNLSWSKTWGGANADYGYAITTTSDGGYAITGQTFSFGDTTNGDMFIARFDSSGSLVWNKSWGGTTAGGDWGNTVIQTSDGGFAVAATTTLGAGGWDAALIKYDSNGNLSWNKTFGNTNDDSGNAVVQTASGGYILVGQTKNYGNAGTLGDALIIRYDSNGAVAGCTSTPCNSPTATTTTPAATVSSVTGTTGTPSATQSNASTAGSTTPSGTLTSIVALSPSTIDVGSALAAQNTAATVPGDGQPFRLRVDLGVSTNAITSAGQVSLKLQYAPMTTSCDASFTNTTSAAYQDVTDTSTIRYYDNTNAVNGLGLVTNANDPTDGGNTLVRQTYQEKGSTNFTDTTAVPVGQDGMWDFALTTNGTLQGTHYCLRIVWSTGTVLNSYLTASSTSAIAELISPSSSFTQSSYRVFSAASPVNTFAKAWGSGTGGESGEGVVQTSDGGYAVTGYTSGFGAGGNDVFLAKYDSSGNLTWNKTWGGTNYDNADAIIQTSDGGYAITGVTFSFGGGNGDVFLLKYDSSGNLTGCTGTCFQKVWGGTATNGEVGYSLAQTSDGGYVVTGATFSFGSGNSAQDLFILKYDSSGNLTGCTGTCFQKTWGGTSSDQGRSVIQTSDGGYIATGFTDSGGTSGIDALLVKYDSSGAVSWAKTWGSSGDDDGYVVIQTSDGGYAITGSTTSFGSTDTFVAKFDSSGNLGWDVLLSNVGANTGWYGFVQTADGGYALEDTTSTYGSGNNDVLLVRLSSTGGVVWSRTWGGSASDAGAGLAKASDGGFVVTGLTNSYGAGIGDMFIAKYDASGNINGCSSTCTNPVIVSSDPTSYVLTPTSTVSSPSGTVSSPSGTVSTPSATITSITALGSSSAVNSALLPQNRGYDATGINTPFRLRVDIDVSGSGVVASGQAFKLQYSVRGSDQVCDASFTGESYADVTTTTPIRYYDASGNASGDGVSWNVNDPTSGTNILVPQTYQEANNFSNAMSAIYASQSGEWEFSLAIASGTLPGNDYCLRVVTSSGSTLGGYTNIADIAYGPSMINLLRQEAWWSRSGVRQNFFIKGQ